MMLAMHMANELLTPTVAALFIAIAGGVLAIASWRTRAAFDPDRIPLMGVMGAFVFAAQMINFPILPGTSGHLGGGFLLAILLGPHAATLVMASILIVQCLIFQDGGLLALGTNILNLGAIPCYLGYAVFAMAAGTRPGTSRLYAAVFGSTLLAVVTGAAMVPIEVWLSGRLTVPLREFMAVMVGLHLLVALGEAIATFLVMAYIVRVRPQLLNATAATFHAARGGLTSRAVLTSMVTVALLLAGVFSVWASKLPDALESLTASGDSQGQTYVRQDSSESGPGRAADKSHAAPFPDYQIPGWSEAMGTRAAGLLGAGVTMFVVWVIGRCLRRRDVKSATPEASPHSHAPPLH